MRSLSTLFPSLSMEYLEEINRLLSIPNGLSNSRDAIYKSAVKFVQKLEKPGSDLGDKMKVDEMRPILSSVRTIGCSIDMECCFAIILKILLRKAVNRDAVGKFGMNAIVQWLGRQGLLASPVTPELGNVILNACFDSNNVMLFLNEGGMRPLLFLLRSQETLIQSSILGALQGICFTAAGKYHMRTCGDAIHSIVLYFMSDELVVRARAVGTIHNLSSDPLAIALIRDSGNYAAIPLLVTLLHDPSAEVCHAAAGTLQNLARDISSREMMHTIPECLERLIDLLFANDVKCQVKCIKVNIHTHITFLILLPLHLFLASCFRCCCKYNGAYSDSRSLGYHF